MSGKVSNASINERQSVKNIKQKIISITLKIKQHRSLILQPTHLTKKSYVCRQKAIIFLFNIFSTPF